MESEKSAAMRVSLLVGVILTAIFMMAVGPVFASGGGTVVNGTFRVTDDENTVYDGLNTWSQVVATGNRTLHDWAPLDSTLSGGASLIMRNTNYMNGVGGVNRLHFRTARGTLSAPSGVLANDELGGVSATGFGTTKFYGTANVGLFFAAAQAMTDTARGAYATIETTPVDSPTRKVAVEFGSDQTLRAYSKIYPGPTSGDARQTAIGINAQSAIPADSDGSDNSYAFTAAGIYQKRAGSWVKITS